MGEFEIDGEEVNREMIKSVISSAAFLNKNSVTLVEIVDG